MFKVFKSYLCARNVFLIKTLPKTYSAPTFKPFYENFFKYADNVAVRDRFDSYKYRDILYTSVLIAKRIEDLALSGHKTPERISFLCPNEAIYVSVLLACWISGNIAVPLSSNHPETLLEHMIRNSQSSLVIASDSVSGTVEKVAKKFDINYFTVDSVIRDSSSFKELYSHSPFFSWSSDYRDRNALIIYTSGTTGLPKGVALTHDNLFAQVSALVNAWEISSSDVILHTLPLYHMHGIMNALLCLLSVGGTVVMRPKFKASEVWNYFMNQNHSDLKVSLFYGVPTMYVMLIDELSKITAEKYLIEQCCEKNIRLMTCGSAPLPVPVFNEWKNITSHCLLERFGMSEVGMALSNPLHGPRIPGSVGNPLPDVEVRLVEDSSSRESNIYVEGSNSSVKVFENKEGELLIKGPNVFKEYWNNKKATSEAFTDNGWFKTGDVATYQNGSFKILGRISADIIKSGGHKLSSLQIESHLLAHPEIADCSVMGIPDEKWGERVAALLVTKNRKEFDKTEIKLWCEGTLPSYAFPSVIKYVDVIPKNAMGKMNKKELKKLFL